MELCLGQEYDVEFLSLALNAIQIDSKKERLLDCQIEDDGTLYFAGATDSLDVFFSCRVPVWSQIKTPSRVSEAQIPIPQSATHSPLVDDDDVSPRTPDSSLSLRRCFAVPQFALAECLREHQLDQLDSDSPHQRVHLSLSTDNLILKFDGGPKIKSNFKIRISEERLGGVAEKLKKQITTSCHKIQMAPEALRSVITSFQEQHDPDNTITMILRPNEYESAPPCHSPSILTIQQGKLPENCRWEFPYHPVIFPVYEVSEYSVYSYPLRSLSALVKPLIAATSAALHFHKTGFLTANLCSSTPTETAFNFDFTIAPLSTPTAEDHIRTVNKAAFFIRSYSMVFKQISLPYADSALEPHISQETLQYHYGKHHAAYVSKLNDLTKNTPLAEKKLLELVKSVTPGVLFNQAAQVWNHDFYFSSLSPNGGGNPTGDLLKYIEKTFGSVEKFKEEFSAIATGHFASGWAWLVYLPKSDQLKIVQTHDAGNPIREEKGIPLMVCDVWEHAYYIDYRNARANYIKAWWNIVNWDFASKNLATAIAENQ